MTSSRIPEVKKKLTFGVLALCCFVLIDCVKVCMTEKGYRYGVSFAAKNESELEERAFLCGQKRQRTRDPPLGSCTCRARGLVPIPVQNGARVSCKWRIGDEFTLSLAKHSHFSFLPSHFPSLPSRMGHHCGVEIRNELTLSVAKRFCPLCSDSLKWREPHDE